MVGEERSIESRGADVEGAIDAGLARLGLKREDVKIDVIDAGSRGLLGLVGAREAVVRLTVIGRPPVAQPAPSQPTPVTPPLAPTAREDLEEEDYFGGEGGEMTGDDLQEGDVAAEIVQTLLNKMQVQAAVSVRLSEPDDLSGRRVPLVDIRGRDLSILIGPQGETLNAIQTVARLMVGHRLHRRAAFVVDVEGFRERRAQALTRLAQHMADKAVKRGRPISLEPMPPNERRIIHVALRDHEAVYTQSTGEGDERKVQILLK